MLKKYRVLVELQVNRAVWRSLGYGDQPSKREVQHFFNYVGAELSPNGAVTARVRYLGAPGAYHVDMVVPIERSWWRHLGFGESSSMREVREFVEAATEAVSHTHSVVVKVAR